MRWQPISEITDDIKNNNMLFLHGPDLIDLDFNPEGVVDGFWQENSDDYPIEGGCFIAALWNNDQDTFYTEELTNVTHFMVKKGPDNENKISL